MNGTALAEIKNELRIIARLLRELLHKPKRKKRRPVEKANKP